MDSTDDVLFGALREMESRLCTVFDGRSAGPERLVAGSGMCTAGFDLDGDTIFDDDLDTAPVFDTYPDDLEDGLVFNTEQVPDGVAVTVLDFAKLVYDAEFAVFNEEYTDDKPVFDEGPVYADEPLFDTEPVFDRVAVFEFAGSEHDAVHGCAQEHVLADVSTACLDFGCDDAPHPECEEAEFIIDSGFVIGANIATFATATDMRFTCSMEFPSDVVNIALALVPRSLQEFSGSEDTGVFDPICRGFNTSYSSIGGYGVLCPGDFGLLLHVHGIITSSLVANWLVISAPIATSGFEYNYWDPGLAGGLGLMTLSKFRSEFAWNHGSPESLQSIELIRSAANLAPSCLFGLPVSLLPQQKCGGADTIACPSICIPAPNDMCTMGMAYTVCLEFEDLASAQLLSVAQMLSKFLFVAMVPDAKMVNTPQLLGVLLGIHGRKLSSEFQEFQFHHDAVRGAVKPLLVSEDSYSSWKLFEVAGLLDVHWLVAAVSEVLILWHVSSSGSSSTHASVHLAAKPCGNSELPPPLLVIIACSESCLWNREIQSTDIAHVFNVPTLMDKSRLPNCAVMLIWMSMGEVMFSGCVLPLPQARCIAICHDKISILGQHTKQYEMECDLALMFAAGIPCHVFACGVFCAQLAAIDVDILSMDRYQLPSVDNVLSTVEVYSSVDSQLEPLYVANLNVAIRTDNWDSAFIYGSHAVVLQRLLSVVQWVLVILRQWCSIMSATARWGEKFPKPISMRDLIQGILPSYPGTSVLQMYQWDQLQLVNCSCLQESVIEGAAMFPGYNHLPAPMSVSSFGYNAVVFTMNIFAVSAIHTEFQGVFSQLTEKKLTQVSYLTEEDVVIGVSGSPHILVHTHLAATLSGCSMLIPSLLAVVAYGIPILCDQQFQLVNGVFENDLYLDNSDDRSLARKIPSAVQYALLHCESDDSKAWSKMTKSVIHLGARQNVEIFCAYILHWYGEYYVHDELYVQESISHSVAAVSAVLSGLHNSSSMTVVSKLPVTSLASEMIWQYCFYQQSSQSHLVGHRLPHSSIHIDDNFLVSCGALSSSVDFKEVIQGLLHISAHWVPILTQGIEKQEFFSLFTQVIQLSQHKQLQITLSHCLFAWLLALGYQTTSVVQLGVVEQWELSCSSSAELDHVNNCAGAFGMMGSLEALQYLGFLHMIPPHVTGCELLLNFDQVNWISGIASSWEVGAALAARSGGGCLRASSGKRRGRC